MPEPKAHVIDDDLEARDSLAFLLTSADIAVDVYTSATDFVSVAAHARGVVVTDLRMPEMDGLELVRTLHRIGVTLPVIVMTGNGDIPLAVEAMRVGVRDFIEKPYDDEAMLAAIRDALAQADIEEMRDDSAAEYRRRIDALSGRERDVLKGLVAGKSNKVIAFDLGISARTVEIYRAKLMAKSGATSLSQLVRIALAAGRG